MRCPSCSHLTSKVVDSRPGNEGQEIRRRRECELCRHRFTTYERCEQIVPLVVKRDGRREEFEREKLRRALRTACHVYYVHYAGRAVYCVLQGSSK